MPKLCLVTLGCPKNIVEGENIAGLLQKEGWELVTDLSRADAAVVHTCSFIADAKKESENIIKKIAKLKSIGGLKTLAVTGCLAQLEGRGIQKRIKGIDICVGTGQIPSLPGILNAGGGCRVSAPGGFIEPGIPRLLSSALPSAYLRLSEGCNHRCSFCIIPKIRGKYKSRPREEIVKEAKSLAARGIRELNLIAQDTTRYGGDIYGELALPGLLKELAGIKNLKWIRLMYAYPGTVTKGLIDVIKNEEKVCKYIDMPVQHVNRRILSMMGRAQGAKESIIRLKKEMPGITLRSTLIAGFPGETREEFRELSDFVSEGWFDALGVFEYSAVPGTPAAGFSGRLGGGAVAERKKELMLRQKKVVARKNRALKGSVVEALIESCGGKNACAGRTSFQAPEVDGRIILQGGLRAGCFARAKVTGSRGYDLTGKII